MFKKRKFNSEENIIPAVKRSGDAESSPKPSTSNDGPNFGPLQCFVATACYGQDDCIVNSLRSWRDEVLKTGTEKGKLLFIRAYYSFIPQITKYTNQPSLTNYKQPKL